MSIFQRKNNANPPLPLRKSRQIGIIGWEAIVMHAFDQICLKPGIFYLPRQEENMDVWPVVACDQYTAQKDKWEAADQIAGENPSALRLIIP